MPHELNGGTFSVQMSADTFCRRRPFTAVGSANIAAICRAHLTSLQCVQRSVNSHSETLTILPIDGFT